MLTLQLMSEQPQASFNQNRQNKAVNKCMFQVYIHKLTASTACWRMDVNLENILFFDWTSFSREDLENSSIFFFLLLPPRSRLEVSYNDPCNERIKVSNKAVTLCWLTGPRGPGTTTVNKTFWVSGRVCSLWTRWHFLRQTLLFRSTRGRRNTRHWLIMTENDRCIQMWTMVNIFF